MSAANAHPNSTLSRTGGGGESVWGVRLVHINPGRERVQCTSVSHPHSKSHQVLFTSTVRLLAPPPSGGGGPSLGPELRHSKASTQGNHEIVCGPQDHIFVGATREQFFFFGLDFRDPQRLRRIFAQILTTAACRSPPSLKRHPRPRLPCRSPASCPRGARSSCPPRGTPAGTGTETWGHRGCDVEVSNLFEAFRLPFGVSLGLTSKTAWYGSLARASKEH